MTLYAQKANIVTVISEDRVDEFIAKGYKVMDATGHIIKDTAYVSNTAEINRLTAEVARLKDELSRAQKILEEKEVELKATAVVKTEEPSTPKTRTRSKRT